MLLPLVELTFSPFSLMALLRLTSPLAALPFLLLFDFGEALLLPQRQFIRQLTGEPRFVPLAPFALLLRI